MVALYNTLQREAQHEALSPFFSFYNNDVNNMHYVSCGEMCSLAKYYFELGEETKNKIQKKGMKNLIFLKRLAKEKKNNKKYYS